MKMNGSILEQSDQGQQCLFRAFFPQCLDSFEYNTYIGWLVVLGLTAL